MTLALQFISVVDNLGEIFNLRGNVAGGGLASDQALPSLTALADDVESITKKCQQ